MRADRLIQIIMLLQTRGKMTTQTLADELDVSRRTILRDIDALSLSGIPIYSDSGHGGGVALDEHYRSRLTGLKELEALTLFITDSSRPMGELGLSDAASSSFLKLLATLPTQHRASVDVMRQRILIDPDWWFHETLPSELWDNLYQAVFDNQQIQILYETHQGDLNQRILEPYSLISKSSNWYLIARRHDDYRIYRVSRIHQLDRLDEHFERLHDFDLQSFWREQSQSFTQHLDDYHMTIQVNRERLVFIRTLLPGRTHIIAENGQWVTLDVKVMSSAFARMLLFELGRDAIILEPTELQAELMQQAQQIVDYLLETD